MRELFAQTFCYTGLILAGVAGVLAAVVVGCFCALVLLVILAEVFDWATTALSRRWHRKGFKPRGRLGRVIYGSTNRDNV